jgi:hypothetical protein
MAKFLQMKLFAKKWQNFWWNYFEPFWDLVLLSAVKWYCLMKIAKFFGERWRKFEDGQNGDHNIDPPGVIIAQLSSSDRIRHMEQVSILRILNFGQTVGCHIFVRNLQKKIISNNFGRNSSDKQFVVTFSSEIYRKKLYLTIWGIFLRTNFCHGVLSKISSKMF